MADQEVQVTSAYAGSPSVGAIPSNVVTGGLLSDTSSALECYVNQRFSLKLQAYIVTYVNSVQSQYSRYAL